MEKAGRLAREEAPARPETVEAAMSVCRSVESVSCCNGGFVAALPLVLWCGEGARRGQGRAARGRDETPWICCDVDHLQWME